MRSYIFDTESSFLSSTIITCNCDVIGHDIHFPRQKKSRFVVISQNLTSARLLFQHVQLNTYITEFLMNVAHRQRHCERPTGEKLVTDSSQSLRARAPQTRPHHHLYTSPPPSIIRPPEGRQTNMSIVGHAQETFPGTQTMAAQIVSIRPYTRRA